MVDGPLEEVLAVLAEHAQAGDRDRAARLKSMARAERDDAAQFRKRLARI